MALSILDGNQSATTLSTIVTGGQHIPAHTVVSLGSQAITDMRSAVSGSVVSVSNFPASQTIAGTVTVGSLPAISGTVTANLSSSNLNTVTIGVRGSVTVGNTTQITDSVVLGFNNVFGNNDTFKVDIRTPDGSVLDGDASVPVQGTVDIGSLPAISGTVTASLANVVTTDIFWNVPAIKITGGNGYGIDIAGKDQGNVRAIFEEGGGIPVYPRDNAGLNAPFPVAGTVTANNPSGALTTRFGSVVTANLATLTSAVTNTSRKFLLVQNIATSTVTIGIGFAPTTTQGIQLTAGAGLTFDAFTPTGAIYWLSSVTGSNFSILEG
jgi:hypothetical protein